MKHKAALVVVILVVLGLSAIAGAVLSDPNQDITKPPAYMLEVNLAISWFGVHTPAHSILLSITEPAFASVNKTYPDHEAIFDPWATESPFTAAFVAQSKGAHYLAVTNLVDNGSTYAENFPWRTFNSTTLSGASLVYSNHDVKIYCLVDLADC
jgi:hypothetical protein